MLEIFARIRFLPLLIFTASMVLTIKVGDIYQGVDGVLNGGFQVTEAQAQDGGAPVDPAPDAGAPAPAAADEGFGDEGFGDEGFGADEPSPQRVLSDDPTLLTQAEIDLLQQLAERRDALNMRERELSEREGLLAAAEARIETQFKEMQVLEATIKQLITTYDEQQKAKVDSLVKLYENMKPKDAAKIFEELEMETLLMVVSGMKERKLAPVMAKMNAERAREVTIELMQLRELPEPGSRAGG